MAALVLDDVVEGLEIPPLVKTASNVQMFMYAAATWNCDRIHYDQQFAREVFGLPDIVQAGPMSADWYAQLVGEWIGDAGFIKNLSYESRSSIVPGDRLECRGRVARTYDLEGYRAVDCELTMVNQKGQDCSPGRARVILPAKDARLDRDRAVAALGVLSPTPDAPRRTPGKLLTPDMLAMIGTVAPAVVSDPITAKEIRRYALAIGDPSRAYHGGADVVAPPAYALWACHPSTQDGFVEELTPGGYPERQAAFVIPRLPLANPLHGGDEHEFFAPIRPGDVLTASTKVVDVYEKIGKTRAMVFVVTETTVTNQRGALVDLFRVTMIYY
jgi:hydroxyacyl-ACP dehydratase HTD2-like protein with hotdog domain